MRSKRKEGTAGHYYDTWSLPEKSNKSKVRWRGSWTAWRLVVDRLSVFKGMLSDSGRPLIEYGETSEVEIGGSKWLVLTRESRKRIYHEYHEFMAQYEGKSDENLPFNQEQLDLFKHILGGGLLTLIPEK